MWKFVLALSLSLLVALAVWYAVTTIPLRTAEGLPTEVRTPARSLTKLGSMPPLRSMRCGGHCGSERWLVKTLSDPDRERVHLEPVDATIEQLASLPRPTGTSDVTRGAPAELTVYRVSARLLALYGEDDGDFHLVLASPRDSTATMIAEVPNPECAGACASGFAEVYARVRQTLMDHLNASGGEARPLVRVTGVGFFDFLHGQTGIAPNGIELHPVLAVEFANTSS